MSSLDVNVNVNKISSKQDSYFDGGLLQLIGWSILGTLITAVTSVYVIHGLYVWYMDGKLIIL